jgi:hypothetical protein
VAGAHAIPCRSVAARVVTLHAPTCRLSAWRRRLRRSGRRLRCRRRWGPRARGEQSDDEDSAFHGGSVGGIRCVREAAAWIFPSPLHSPARITATCRRMVSQPERPIWGAREDVLD